MELNDLVNPRQKFSPATCRAIRALAKSKPWQGTRDEREQKIKTCHLALTSDQTIYLEFQDRDDNRNSGQSSATRGDYKAIIMRGRVSVVTYLYLYAITQGKTNAVKWAVSAFKRFFPISFSRCKLENGLVVNTRTGTPA
jgi:hypothetical protein